MTITFRHATRTDAEPVASLLTELGYASTATDVIDRLQRSLQSETSWLLLAQSANDVIGLISAELMPYFPTGTTLCRVTALVVAAHHRGAGVGEKLLACATEFAREHRCSGVELTSAHHRRDAHRFYERLGFSPLSLRFFRPL